MIKHVKDCEKTMIISSIITLILGIILVIEPTKSIRLLAVIIAIIFELMGIFQLIDYLRKSREEKIMSLSLILGAILIVIGIFLYLNIDSLVNFITILIGITIAMKSLFKIQFALNIRDITEKWKYNLIMGLLGMIIGAILLVNPFHSAILFLRIIGIVFIIGSVIEIMEIIMVLKTLDDAKEIPFYDKHSKEEDKWEKYTLIFTKDHIIPVR